MASSFNPYIFSKITYIFSLMTCGTPRLPGNAVSTDLRRHLCIRNEQMRFMPGTSYFLGQADDGEGGFFVKQPLVHVFHGAVFSGRTAPSSSR